MVKDIAAGKNGQNQKKEQDLQSFSDTGENTTTKEPRNDKGIPIELNLTKNGTFLVSINDAEEEDLGNNFHNKGYHRLIGNYIDMIDCVTSATGIKPKIALVTTATDEKRCSDNLLKTTKAHLESLEVNHSFVNNVTPISLGRAESFQKIKNLSFETNIITRLFKCRPHLWQKFLKK